MRALFIAGLVAAGLTMAAPAAGAQVRTITDLQGQTPVATEGDLALISIWEGRQERLSIVRDGVITPLPVNPRYLRAQDIGTDAAGNPVVVYNACTGSDGPCKVMRLRLNPDGTAAGEPAPVRGLPASVGALTVSRGMLAYSSGTKVYTRPLEARGKIRPRRQPAARKRNCDVVYSSPSNRRAVKRDGCRVRNLAITALELRNTQLAVGLYYDVKFQFGGGVDELRLVGTRRRKAETISSGPINEGGASFLGDPAFDAKGRLVYSSLCYDGCGPAELLRFDAQKRTLDGAKLTRDVLGYGPLGNNTALLVVGGEPFDYDCPAATDGSQCTLAQTGPLKWKRLKNSR